ncbi:MAG: aspartate tRNAAsn/Glu-tRNAGln amidotransferase subunit and related amidase protein [Gemmatimonadetes bacterium]|nr:aspartate tRNAAsn/Glu-tRNAGln amidotransferase subunit and related amidase protein [Gemmatimonadota bacterium]
MFACFLGAVSAFAQKPAPSVRGDLVYERSIMDLQTAMTSGTATSADLVTAYLERIAAYDHNGPALNAVIRLNPNALKDAAVLDKERRAGHVRGPLHGIPVILKDNYGTRDMPTSAGSIALAGNQPAADAFQVRRLRDAGAVIIGKANMHELAAGITSISSLGGQTCNPYDPDRNPGGSSGGSGAAAAASFATFTMGSDTCGSIRIPSAVQNLFGLRPTKGLSSIAGIVPLAHTQDVGGPLTRTVRDLAIVLDATVGPDPADSATRILDGHSLPHFVELLDTTSLRGARFAVITSYLGSEADDAEGTRIIRAAIEKMRARGADIVDVTLPGLDTVVNRASVIEFEFKYDLIGYLANSSIPSKSLADILDRGLYASALEQTFRRRDSTGSRDNEPYRAALARRVIARDMVVAFLDANKFDALIYPTLTRKAALIGEPQRGTTCTLSAVTGLPALTMPAGFTPDGLPIGVELLGRPLADARLVAFAYDYEQATHPRRAPSTTPALVNGHAPAPMTFAAAARGKTGTARGTFTFDPGRRALGYSIRTSGNVSALNLVRDSAGKHGPVLRQLVANGTHVITLGEIERRDLLSGWLALGLSTRDEPAAMIRSVLKH